MLRRELEERTTPRVECHSPQPPGVEDPLRSGRVPSTTGAVVPGR